MIKRAFILSLALFGKLCFADEIQQIQPIGPFGGLNTNISQEAIDSAQSPDLLNVDVSAGGKSVKKRQGYGIDSALAVTTSAVHNLYKFFDSSGNEVRLAFNDNRLSSSINGATWSTVITTGTVGATWDCTDYLGFAYCVSSSFDPPIKTNGTTAGTTGVGGTNAVPAGSLVSNSGDRLLVGATGSNPSRLYYSASASFTDFSLGTQPSSSSFDEIVAPGSKLTHLSYHFGRWLWWKDQSFGFIIGTGQFDLQIVVVSNTIGTLDNTDVYDGNYVYFRGSDNQIYTYDGSVLSRSISSDISPSLISTNRRKANQWTQTTQADWQTDTFAPTANFSTTITVGDVQLSSVGVTLTTRADFGTAESLIGLQFTGTDSGSVILSTDSVEISNNSFESGIATNWAANGGFVLNSVFLVGTDCTIAAKAGANYVTTTNNTSAFSLVAVAVDAVTGSSITSTTVNWLPNSCTYTERTLTMTGYARRLVRLVLWNNVTGGEITSDAFLSNSNAIQFWTASNQTSASNFYIAADVVHDGPKSDITSGGVQSTTYDLGLTSAVIQGVADWTVSNSTPLFSITTATGTTGPFSSVTTSTGVNVNVNRYVRFASTISLASTEQGLTTIDAVGFVARSTGGVVLSIVNHANTITSWGPFVANDQTNGGTIVYYTRASTNAFAVTSTTPAWVAQTKSATVAASTGTYMQARADFSLTAATQAVTLNDFTFNWTEGSASDKMYGTYFKNGIWFSVSIGTSATTNNRIFRYDLLSNLWTLYDIPANGFLTYNNNLYFAGPSTGVVYQFGNNVYADNGTSINSYWKSKPFFGDSPFTDKDLRLASWYIAEDSGTTLSLTYTLNESTTVSRTLSLFDARRNVIQNNWNFPLGSVATNFNVQFGDNSMNPPWEVFGGALYFVPRPWKVSL